MGRDSTVGWVSQREPRWKFSPTRNDATEEASAISIVKKALGEIGVHLTEAAITKLWNKGPWKEALERIGAD